MVKKIALLAGSLLFALAAFLFVSGLNQGYAQTDKNIVPVKKVTQEQNQVIVYYFYAKPRCASCKKIEAYTEEATNSLNNSKIVYKAVNLEEPENKHYYKDYGLYTKAVILSEVKDGEEIKSKNLDKIWTKLNNEQKFKKYITDEIQNFAGQ